jgi:hypothetical protein
MKALTAEVVRPVELTLPDLLDVELVRFCILPQQQLVCRAFGDRRGRYRPSSVKSKFTAPVIAADIARSGS